VKIFVSAATAALVVVGVAAASPIHSKTAASGSVRATVTWRNAHFFEAKSVRLRITRSGATALDTTNFGVDRPQTIKARDLDADGEPEVLVDFYTGGAHCCFFSRIYRFEGSTYIPLRHLWGDLGYGLHDLDGDGTPELQSADDRFAYAFTAYAASAFPIQIWEYDGGRLVDVTRRYSTLIRRDAARLWRDSLRQRKDRSFDDVRGILAAWAADEYLLGRSAQAWTTLRKLNRTGVLKGDGPWPHGSAYLRKLRTFLQKNGYAG
jgi:hypothetical protein